MFLMVFSGSSCFGSWENVPLGGRKMTAGFGFCRRPFVGALAIGLFAYGASVQGQEIRLQPITATGNVIALPDPADADDTEIILSNGDVFVTLFVELSGWDSIAGGHPGDVNWFLGGPQGTIDSSTYLGSSPTGDKTRPGYDLEPLGWPEGTPTDGAFMALKVCGNIICVGNPFDPGCEWDPLSVGPDECSPPDTYSFDRPDYVFYGKEHTPGVSVSSKDYAYFAASPDCAEDPRCDPPNSCRFYMGTLILYVPKGAKGTYNVNYIDDPNFTMFNSCPGPPIPGLIRKAAQITIAAGKCCYEVGNCQNPNPLTGTCCVDNITQKECDMMGAPRLPIDPDGTCETECCQCLTPEQCDDGDACTDEHCNDCVCSWTDNYDPSIDCCDPATGDLETILDDFVCTDDICVHDPYSLTHPPNKGDCGVDDAVHDGYPEQADCYTNFACGQDGLCSGQDINTIPCPTGDPIADGCPEGTTECEGGFCLCEVCSTLVLDVESGARGVIDPNCFSLGQPVNVNVAVVGGSKALTGGQFLIHYDPDCLDYVGTSPGSPWTENPIKIVDEDAGTIFYVALVPDASMAAPVGVVVTLHFLKLDGCDECQMCFDSINPQNTILMDEDGYAVVICNPDDCAKKIRLRGDLTVGGPEG
jgi:hypothetical protein